ncbi:GNAT family N-acetyltransferase [Benzoatithermus flavus]|uniref:GNAT family N-acetyltransferase n=1 Tax=Benzoatithermus flavus TaxID=3108223 RepID=A0ABU8XV73_9PROT
MSEPVIAVEPPHQPEVARLIEALDDYLGSLYPAESNHLLDLDALAAPDVRFFVARIAGRAVGCAALRLAADYGELKRMFVLPEARGRQVGRRLLARIEAELLAHGLGILRLETGGRQPEALGLYRAAGFAERGPFGDYPDDPLSIFMEKRLR